MLAYGFVTVFFVALVAVNVVGYHPEPIKRALAERGPAPFEPIQAYVNRDHVGRGIAKRQADVIPEEVATKAPDGVTVAYTKRQAQDVIPAEVATKAPQGVTVVY